MMKELILAGVKVVFLPLIIANEVAHGRGI